MKVYKMILNIATTNLQTDGTTVPTITTGADNLIEWRFKFPVLIESITIDLAEYVNDLYVVPENPGDDLGTKIHSINCYFRLDDFEDNLPNPIRFDDIENSDPSYTDITQFIINSGGIAKLIPKNNIPFSCKVFGIWVDRLQ